MHLGKLSQLAKDRFPMEPRGIHGPKHWERVYENGMYLAKHSGGIVEVVQAFAFLHDCCRETDGADPSHGERAARFAETIRETLELADDHFELLHYACCHHEKGRVSQDATVGTCWDSDRLDLGRVGIKPNPRLLSTDRAKRPTVIEWAYSKSRGQYYKLKE